MNKSINENTYGSDEIVSDPNGERVFEFSRKKSIAERRGFNKTAPNINTNPLLTLPTRSPQFTIPPGISPTALLESPVMLPNSQV